MCLDWIENEYQEMFVDYYKDSELSETRESK